MAKVKEWENGQDRLFVEGKYTFTYEIGSGSVVLQIRADKDGTVYQDVTDSAKTVSDQLNMTLAGSHWVKAVITGDAKVYSVRGN